MTTIRNTKGQFRNTATRKVFPISKDFNFKILLADNSELKSDGGIGITDLKGFDEIYVESAGLDALTLDRIKNAL
jgi:hypothetical protein